MRARIAWVEGDERWRRGDIPLFQLLDAPHALLRVPNHLRKQIRKARLRQLRRLRPAQRPVVDGLAVRRVPEPRLLLAGAIVGLEARHVRFLRAVPCANGGRGACGRRWRGDGGGWMSGRSWWWLRVAFGEARARPDFVGRSSASRVTFVRRPRERVTAPNTTRPSIYKQLNSLVPLFSDLTLKLQSSLLSKSRTLDLCSANGQRSTEPD